MSIESGELPIDCPFCGADGGDMEISTGSEDREGIPAAVCCPECGAQGPWDYTDGTFMHKPVAAWNKRARDAAIRKEALENIRDVVLDKLIDLFNEMREELEEPK